MWKNSGKTDTKSTFSKGEVLGLLGDELAYQMGQSKSVRQDGEHTGYTYKIRMSFHNI